MRYSPRLFHVTAISTMVLLLAFFGCEEKDSANDPVSPGRDSYSDPAIIPQVIRTIPEEGSTGPWSILYVRNATSNPHAIVHFNKYMDLASVVDSVITVEGFDRDVVVRAIRPTAVIPWFFRSTAATKNATPFTELVELEVRDKAMDSRIPFEVGKTYRFTIDTTITDINGNNPAAPFSFSFTPEPMLRIHSTNPANNTTDVDVDINAVRIDFNSTLSPDILSHVRLIPQPPVGSWEIMGWDSSYLEFWFNYEPFLTFSTSFDIVVDAGAADAAGNQLASEYRTNFRTEEFRLTEILGIQNDTLINLTSQVIFFFNGDLDTSTIGPAISITPQPASILYGGITRSIGIQPAGGFTGGTQYTITIGTSLKATDGTALLQPVQTVFHTPPFRITGSNPTEGDTSFARFGTLWVATNAYLDAAAAVAAASITPPPTSINWYAVGTNLQAAYSLTPSTWHTMTIDPSMRSRAGDTLSAPYVVTFKTRP